MFKIFVILCVAVMAIDAVPLSPSKQRVYPQLIALPSRLGLPQPQPTALAQYPTIPQVVINRQMEILYKSFADTVSLELLIEKIAEHLDLDSLYEAIGNITLNELYSALKPIVEIISSICHHIEHFWEILSKKPTPPQPPKEPACEDCDHPHEHVDVHHEEGSFEHVEEHQHVHHHDDHKHDKDHKEHEADNKHPVHIYTEVTEYTETTAHADKLVIAESLKNNKDNPRKPVKREAAIVRSLYKPNAGFPRKMA